MTKMRIIVFCVLGITGCLSVDDAGNQSQNIAMQIFTQAVDNKCRSELNEQSIYQTVSIFMTKEQKQSFENKVCGCVSKKAPENITWKELGQIAVDSQARPVIVASVVGKTLKSCVSEFVQGAK